MGKVVRVVGVVITGLALAGCWDAPPAPAPVAPTPTAPPRAPVPARASAPVVEDDVARVLRQAPLAPSFHALALGLDVDAAAKIDVSIDGEGTLFEVDLADGPIPLRRARALGPSAAPGLFGRGWRSELESCVLPAGEGALVVRVQGATPFVPLEGDVLVSLAGEVEWLRRTPTGWELAAADGRVFSFDAQGRLASLEPGFTVERAPGRLVLTGAAGARVTLSLDASGRVAQAEACSFVHDAATGELLAAGERRYETDARGRLVRAPGVAIALDGDDRVARLTRDDGCVQSYTFAPIGLARAEVSTPQGRFAYRQVDDGFFIDTPRGEDRAWLDARGRLIALRRAGERTQVFDRDDLEQAFAALEEPALEDAADDGDEVARALGLVVTRDGDGRLSEVLTRAGRRWTFGWEARRLVSTDGPAGPVTLARDERGRLTSRRDASGRELAYELDAHGRPVSVGARTGEQVVWTRDEHGAVKAIESQDAAGRPARIEYEREDSGAVVGVALACGASLRYAETADRVAVSTPWGPFVTTYDAQGQPESLATPAGLFRFSYDEHGRRTETEYPNGLVVERARDQEGRVVRQVARHGGRIVSEVEAAWGERGAPTSTTRDGVATRYAHDASGRLTRLERDGHVATWAWNDDADRTAETRDGAARDVRFDERGRLVSRSGSGRTERFVHDEAGRLLERTLVAQDGRIVGRDRFDHDGFGRLTRAARAGRPIVDYTYDPLGRVLSRTVGGETTRFVHDGERLLAELGPGARERVYVWGPADDEPLAWCERACASAPWSWRFVVSSDLHTSLVHTDDLGRVAAQDDLDPWGAGRAANDHPVFFAGHLVDPVAGLVPMRARWYDPSLGRFLTPDPAGLAAGPNAYVYVSGRPLSLVDPLGLQEAAPEEPGLFTRFGRWVGDTAAAAKDTVVGATEGLGYLTGLHGTAQERAAARDASWDDLASGRAQSRALGAVDGYVQGVSLGLIDPNTSRFAYDADQARRGRAYGDAGAIAFGLINGAGALRVGAVGLAAGARALPGALRALPAAARALPGAVRALPGVAAQSVRAAPGLARSGLGWLQHNRGALARGLGRMLGEQAQGAYRVTVGPFVSLGKALLRPLGKTRQAFARAPRALPSAGATTLVDDVAGAATTLADDAAGAATTLADDAARAGADDVVKQVAVAPPASPQNGIVQVLGDGPPTGTVATPRPGQGAPQAPRAPPVLHRPARLDFVKEGESFVAYDLDGGRFVGSGRLTKNGVLHLLVDVPGAGLPTGKGFGREAIVGIHDAFEASGREVRGIGAAWIGGGSLADNFDEFIKLKATMSVEQAALGTPTGKAAKALGFGRVLPGSYRPRVDETGAIIDVMLTFVR